MVNQIIDHPFVRFALVGGGATLLQYVLLIGFVELAGLNAVAASAASFSLSALFNYWVNYHFTFTSTKKHSETLPKFVITAAIGLAVNTAVFSLLVTFAPHYVLAQMGATAAALVTNFLLHRHWIYRS